MIGVFSEGEETLVATCIFVGGLRVGSSRIYLDQVGTARGVDQGESGFIIIIDLA